MKNFAAKPVKVKVEKIPLEKIRLIKWLPQREDMGDLVSLAKSLKSRGDVDVPLKVRPAEAGFFELVWGARRLEAAKLAGLSGVTCLVEPLSDEEVMNACFVENMFRKEKNPIEEAEFFQFWSRKTGKTYEEIAEQLGISPKYIYNRVELLGLSQSVINELKRISIDRKIGLLPLLYLHKVKDEHLQLKIFREFVEQSWTVRELRHRIDEVMLGFRQPTKPSKSLFYDLSTPLAPDDLVTPNVSHIRESVVKPKKFFTHFDTPSLFFENGKTIDQYPPDWFIGKCYVVNVSGLKENELIYPDHVRSSLERSYLPPFSMLFLYTGWYKFLGSEHYERHPVLSRELAEWLVDKKTKVVGFDMPDPEREKTKEIHRLLLSNDVLILENLADMSAIAGKRVMVYAMPTKIRNGEIAPARVIARVRRGKQSDEEKRNLITAPKTSV